MSSIRNSVRHRQAANGQQPRARPKPRPKSRQPRHSQGRFQSSSAVANPHMSLQQMGAQSQQSTNQTPVTSAPPATPPPILTRAARADSAASSTTANAVLQKKMVISPVSDEDQRGHSAATPTVELDMGPQTGTKKAYITSVQIPRFEAGGDLSKPVTFYVCELRDEQGTEWQARFRYSEIRRHHEEMQAVFPKANQLPRFPSKEIFAFNKGELDFLEKRRTKLEIYLSSLLAVRQFQTDKLLAFLQKPNYSVSQTTSPYGGSRRNSASSARPLAIPAAAAALVDSPARSVSAAPTDAHRYDAAIASWYYSNDPSDPSKQFIAYEIEIREFYTLHDSIGWKFQARYDQLAQLRRQMDSQLNTAKASFTKRIPELPPGRVSYASPKKEIDALARGLTAFMQQMVRNPHFMCSALSEFIQLTNPQREFIVSDRIDL